MMRPPSGWPHVMPPFHLPQDDHVPGGHVPYRLQRVEVGSTRYAFACFVPAIPMNRTSTTAVDSCSLMSDIEALDDAPERVIDCQHHFGVLMKLVRNSCVRVERIRVVRQQSSVIWSHLCKQPLHPHDALLE